MAQPNVAREPSMEEILASIRRIIESNDPVAARDAVTSLPPVYGGEEDETEETIHLTVDDDAPLAFSVAPANDPAPSGYYHAPATQQPAPQMRQAAPAMEYGAPQPTVADASRPPVQNKSISLADLAARVRAAADRGEPAPRHPASPAAPQQHATVARETMSELRGTIAPTAAQMPSMASPYLQQPQDEARSRFADAPASRREIEQPVSAASPLPVPQTPMQEPPAQQSGIQYARAQIAVTTEVPQANPPAPIAAPAPSAALTASAEDMASRALMSASAGELVARSFNELVAAVDGSQRRSLDEMAEEMLRPMLQEWLDDNLPTLVERLVREEIERVARGPRR